MSMELITIISVGATMLSVGVALAALIITGQNSLRREMQGQRKDIDGLREENRAEFKAIREENQAEFKAIREENQAEFGKRTCGNRVQGPFGKRTRRNSRPSGNRYRPTGRRTRQSSRPSGKRITQNSRPCGRTWAIYGNVRRVWKECSRACSVNLSSADARRRRRPWLKIPPHTTNADLERTSPGPRSPHARKRIYLLLENRIIR